MTPEELGEGDDGWISRVMQATVENAAAAAATAANDFNGSPSSSAQDDRLPQGSRCAICLEDNVTDPCVTWPCRHQEGCWDCVRLCASRIRHCTLCRAEIDFIIRGSTGERFDPSSDEYGQRPSALISRHEVSPRAYSPRLSEELPPLHANSNGPHGLDGLDRAVERRRSVYFHQRYSRHVGSNQYSQYREITPQMFVRDPELVSKARMWIRRELLVFSFLRLDRTHPPPPTAVTLAAGSSAQQSKSSRQRMDPGRRRAQNAEFLLEYIIAILKLMDIQGSAGEAENMISEYLGRQDARLFLHELRAWLRSPFTRLEDWDEAVQYDGEVRPDWLAGIGWPRNPDFDENGDPVPEFELVPSNTRLNRNRDQYVTDRYRERYWRRTRRSRSARRRGENAEAARRSNGRNHRRA